ncbi:MAG TPA: hypothetical protein VII92_03660 [Anaerolineae bacterium]
MNDTTPSSPRACTLSIAGIGLTLLSADAALIEQLRRNYHAFLADGPARLVAKVQTDQLPGATDQLPADATRLPEAAALPITIFRAGVLHFTRPGSTGFIDLDRDTGELSITSTQPFEDADYFVRAAYALLAFRAGGLLFHAAGIARHGRGYLFFGKSGSGKTTISRLTRGSPSHSIILNDDLVLLLPHGGAWQLYATPFSNPTQFAPSGPHDVKLSQMYRLVQSRRVFIEAMPRSQAIAEIVASAPIVSTDPGRAIALLSRAEQLEQAVPVRRLHFLPDDSFWQVIGSE